MTPSPKSNTLYGALFQKISTIHDSRKHLQDAVQLAIQIEFMTIPAYLTALYSIQDVQSNAYQLLRSVVMEEMFHANQAANLLVAIGGSPKFTGKVVPTYPGYLPHSNPATMPYIGLSKASISVFGNVFAAIEEPAEHGAPAEGTLYDTISQVYKSIEDGLKNYSGKEPLFKQNPKARQRTTIYPGKFGGKPIEVSNLKEALKAIDEIVEQGEGSVPESGAYNPVESHGTYNHYGNRADGTYGPILGTPYEMSHFKKFRSIALDTANFPSTFPIVSNPVQEDFKGNALLEEASLAFNCAYSVMLEALEKSFEIPAKKDQPDTFYSTGLPIMHQILPSLARIMMNTPIRKNGDEGTGPNGAPTFLYLERQNLPLLVKHLEKVISLATPEANENNSIGIIISALQESLQVAKASAGK